MQSILLPTKVDFVPGAHRNEAVLEMEPFYQGYGTTIGNALRRVLLSSLPGAAITSVKFDGLTHEFSAVPNVAEDALQIILNLKQVRVKCFSDEPVRLKLSVSGEKKVTAGDFEKNSQVEIANPDFVLATVTDPKAEFNMEVIVEKGRGYAVTEERDKSNLEAGMIAIDAIFTPVKSVGIKIENTRVGQITNYDKLVLSIETDGTTSPREVVSQAAKILTDHLRTLISVETSKTEGSPIAEEKPVKKARKSKKVKEEAAAEEAAPANE